MTLWPEHWTTLVEAMCSGGAVRHLHFSRVDFSALNNDALLVVVGCRGLQSLRIRRSVVPSGFATDDLIRCSLAKGLIELCIFENDTDSRRKLAEDAILDFCFPGNAVETQSRTL